MAYAASGKSFVVWESSLRAALRSAEAEKGDGEELLAVDASCVPTAAEGGPPLTLFGTDYPTQDGTPIRDYVHVVDLAEAHRLALEATAPGDPRTATHLVCNLGGGRGFSVREVLDAAEQVLGRPVPHAIGDRREGDPPSLVAAIERARDALGWSPRRSSLEEMIGSAWAWRSSRAGSG